MNITINDKIEKRCVQLALVVFILYWPTMVYILTPDYGLELTASAYCDVIQDPINQPLITNCGHVGKTAAEYKQFTSSPIRNVYI